MEPSLSNSLVVEGNILDGDTTVIRLSRVSAVANRNLITESGATVQVQGDDNSSFAFAETEPGLYKASPINLNASNLYRLKISAGGKEYESDWVEVRTTSEIDSVYWKRDERDNAVEISVMSHGNQDDSRYYKWDYDEVWEFHAKYESKAYIVHEDDAFGNHMCTHVTREGITYESCAEPYHYPTWLLKRNDSMYTCWKYQTSSTIHIGSTAGSSDNIIQAPIRKIENNGWEISWLYSILVKQTGLSKEGYEFYKILKGNSEGLGSIFDAQPSQMKTNFKCIDDPSETVIGFVDATNVKSKRLFISIKEFRDWRYFDGVNCVDTIANQPDLTFQKIVDMDYVPTEISYDTAKPYKVTGYKLTTRYCADCRKRGVHKKPDFWPQ